MYLVNLGEEATTDELSAEVLPELQLADAGAEPMPAVRLAVGVCRLAKQRGAAGLRGHVQLTHPGDFICRGQKTEQVILNPVTRAQLQKQPHFS